MIHIEHLSKRYGDTQALTDLTLEVPKGELFCFLGPNGAGKTTTIKILTGLLRPTSGTASIAGYDVQKESVKTHQCMGYIPDMPFLYDRLTPVEFLLFIGELYGMSREAVASREEDIFDLFGLQDYRRAIIKDLSHGMRQRLIYACAFLHEPQVLFIDEPLIGLDPRTIRLIKDLLIQKARAGMTIFLTTHILALAEDIADRIGIIQHGRLTALGTLDELLSKSRRSRDLENLFLEVTGGDEVVGLEG
jgi:ABC-2 type transport system ATP-binding protein